MFLIVVAPASAQTAQSTALTGLQSTNSTAGFAEGDPATTIGAAIGVILGALGLVLFIITVYGGIQMMTAGGKPDQFEKGRKMIVEGIIGMVICLLAWSLTSYVVNRITAAVSGSEFTAPTNEP